MEEGGGVGAGWGAGLGVRGCDLAPMVRVACPARVRKGAFAEWVGWSGEGAGGEYAHGMEGALWRVAKAARVVL